MNSPKNLEKLKEIALALAPEMRGDSRCFHVAAIYNKRKMISLAHNKKQSHPKNIEYNYYEDCGCHAELMAILRGRREDYTGYTMAVVRVDRNEKINTSSPCKFCARVITSLNFKRVFATDKNGEFQEINFN